MVLPAIQGVIRRRVLVNYRVDPDAVREIVPEPFELRLVDGWAIAGLCLIRLEQLRPTWLNAGAGLSSESVAYRVAVSGPDGDGVFIPRRDTASRAQAVSGGRLFPARFGYSRFRVLDDESRLSVVVTSADGAGDVELAAYPASTLPESSVFDGVAEASRFFECDAVGWSCSRQPGHFDGVELRLERWEVSPLAVESVKSSFYDDGRRFPPGSIAFDSALVMRDIPHEWHGVAPQWAGGRPARQVGSESPLLTTS